VGIDAKSLLGVADATARWRPSDGGQMRAIKKAPPGTKPHDVLGTNCPRLRTAAR